MRDLVKLVSSGCERMKEDPDRDLTAEEVKKIIEDFKGEELSQLIGAVYAIGYEEGYRAGEKIGG